MIWFTSDLHFGHDRSFIYEPRGYSNIYEEAEDLIEKFNSVITWEDSVYIVFLCQLITAIAYNIMVGHSYFHIIRKLQKIIKIDIKL